MRSSIVCVLACVLAACAAKSNNSKVEGPPTADGADTRAAQGADNAANSAGAADTGTAAESPVPAFLLRQIAILLDGDFNSTVDYYRCTGQVMGTISDSNGTRTLDANTTFTSAACTGKLKLDGTQTVHAVWTAGLLDFNRTVQGTENMSHSFGASDTVAVSSLDSTAPSYTYNGVGRPANGNTTVWVSINEHRVSTNGGETIFDHNVTTPTPVQIDSTFTGADASLVTQTRTINGTVDVHHNLAKFNAVHAFANVVHDIASGCLCPSGGSITQTVTMDSGGGTYIRNYTFTSCGVATVTTSSSTVKDISDGTVQVTWEDCQD